MAEVIHADFTPEYRNDIFMAVKYLGIKRVEKQMLSVGLHPSFVKALLRNIMRNMGW